MDDKQHYEALDEYCLMQIRLSRLYPREKYKPKIDMPTEVFSSLIQI